MFESSGPRNKLSGLLIFVLIIASGIILIRGEMKRSQQAPDQEEWDLFVEEISPLLKDGDILRFLPTWDNLGPKAFQGTIAGSFKAPFSSLDWRIYKDPIRWMGFKRLVLVGWSGYVDQNLRDFEKLWGPGEALVRTTIFSAQAFELPESPLRWNGIDSFAEAKVRRIDSRGHVQACPWNGEVHDCPGRGGWRDINRRSLLVGDVAQDCIFMEPSPDGASVEITYEKIELSPGQTLLARVGNSMEAARRNAGGRLHVEIKVDDKIALKQHFHHHDFAWIPMGVRFSDALGKGPYQVRVSIKAEKSGYRQECLELLVLDPGWEAWGAPGYGHRFRAAVAEEQAFLSVFP